MAVTRSLNNRQDGPDGIAHAAGARFEGFIGASPMMRELYIQIDQTARSRAPVFISGESGTGKEVTAQALHARSARCEGPIIALNCSAIPSDLMESEIFGHKRGAFTGAVTDHVGAAEAADGGTLFLDEICEMDLALQAKLLRFLETGTVRRVGDTQDRAVDVRIVCATNRAPQAEINAGRFRADLYYRLHVLPLTLPPLRARPGDVPILAQYFLDRASAEEGRLFEHIDQEALGRLLAYSWPGNVRELENVIRRAVVMHAGPVLTVEMLGAALDGPSQASQATVAHMPRGESAGSVEPFWLQERRIIEGAIARFNGHIGRAAAALEISPSTIYRKRQAWDAQALASFEANAA
ncbi:MAG: sigma-54 dependent transcriptional regulator [Pseudomonadota bacterium]